ncbi:hypothetical protein [Endozoicomonas sp. SESOKO1]|uniref:hypothetical protein n=1 Tax=Endozoicomonas sp. SESOKO1 TaxID=2828742 RepID=UPI002149450E|nr:hypothetical protein [Endozoicomonas sp. SESOKO1]
MSSVHGVTVSESVASGQAFSRGVASADSIPCHIRTDEMAENHFHQQTVPFHNPFHDSRFKKRSVAVVVSHAIKGPPLHLPVTTDAQKDQPAPAYIPENEHFSIQSILGLGPSSLQDPSVDNNRGQKSDESCSLPIQRKSSRNQNNPAYAQRQRERARERKKELRKDPAYVQRQNERTRELRKEHRKDPVFVEREREYRREYQMKRRRELRKDPAYVERERKYYREYQRKRLRELRKDPAYVERERKYYREYQSKRRREFRKDLT